MATEIAHEPAAAREPLTLSKGAEVLSGILNREEPQTEEAPVEAEPVAEETPQTEEVVEEPEKEEPVQEVEATEEPAKEESEDVTSEVELEPAQVAQMLGLEEDALEVDEDGAIQVHAKIDGKPAKVSLKDLRHSYELAETHEERLRQLGRERKAFEDESKARLERMANQVQEFGSLMQTLEADYAADFQSVNWDQLRQEDPVEYNAKRLDYEDRKKRLDEFRTKGQQQYQAFEAERGQKLLEQQTEGAKHLAEAFSGTAYKGAPEWGDSESQRLAKWIQEQGFSAEDIGSVGVWQVFKWARDSMLREQELRTAKETVKKVVKKTKIAKPGKPQAPGAQKKAKDKEYKMRQRKSGGSMSTTVDRIKNILNG